MTTNRPPHPEFAAMTKMTSDLMATNPELELAYRYISHTNRHVFLTGKAGTGKTTFLHRVKAEIPKRMAVVAPTGVAAINAKGVTIHSLFQLPFGTLMPERMKQEVRTRRFSQKKQDLIKSLDLLIIDEISMVRADMLDAIDAVLRHVRRREEPFGGLQLLMIGDLHQLPPVVKDSDWREMRELYKTSYFFASLALQKARAQVIQLKHIYRQSDDVFINLLNKVRNNRMDQEVFDTLNSRYRADFRPDDAEGYITLSSHNHTSLAINREKLTQLQGKAYTFKASVTGEFPESMYPNEAELTFKIGAQVMFNKNDLGDYRQYFNGKIGTITAIEQDEITVSCPDDTKVTVSPVVWENRKYSLGANKEVQEDIVGTYEQHPLKLAWSITIHKSQGLTFENVVIDAQAAFAHGQVYVALSRCKSFEGIVLRTPIDLSSVRTDSVVKNYSSVSEQNQPTVSDLLRDKHAYQADCLRELFNFNYVERAARWLHRGLLENEKSIQGDTLESYTRLLKIMDEELVLIGNKFLPRLELYFRNATLPSENQELTERLEGAAPYFIKLFSQKILPEIKDFAVLTDNKAIEGNIAKRVSDLYHLLFVKYRVFMALDAGFDTATYVKARADADIDFLKVVSGEPKSNLSKVPKNIANRELYLQLVTWRQRVALAEDVSAFTVISNKAMLEISNVLPTSKASLLRIGGFGKTRCDKYGKEVLEIIDNYLKEAKIPGDLLVHATKDEPKKDTKVASFELFEAGKTIAEIATARNLKETTIFTHLAHFVLEGSLDQSSILDAETHATLLPYFQENTEPELKKAFEHFNGKYDYGQLRLVRELVALEEE